MRREWWPVVVVVVLLVLCMLACGDGPCRSTLQPGCLDALLYP